MKVKYSYVSEKGDIWHKPICRVIDEEKYDDNVATYLPLSIAELYYLPNVDRALEEIEKVEKGEIECHKTGIDIFAIDVYKDRVEFIYFWEDEDWPDWSCSLEEYKRIILGQRAFLMLPEEPESYLEIKVNDL